MFALPWNKVVLRREGSELNPNAQLLPVPRARRYRDPPAPGPPVAKARVERAAEAKAAARMDVPYALPYMQPIARADAGQTIGQILAGPPPPKRSNAANPLPQPEPEPAAGAPLPADVKAIEPAAVPGGTVCGAGVWPCHCTVCCSTLQLAVRAKAATLPPRGALAEQRVRAKVAPTAAGVWGAPTNLPLAFRPKAASLPPGRAKASAPYEDLMRRARALDEGNAGLDEPRTYNPHPVSY
jgi:hypothetical protein